MKPRHRFYLVDVFAQRRYAGNPLAVVVSDDPLSTSTMQKIAAEINFSETTFASASPEANGGYALRVFTPVREIAFTGHPILGSAWVLRQFVEAGSADKICLNLGIGAVEVSFEPDNYASLCWFTAPPVTLGATIDSESIAAALGLQIQDIDTGTPVQLAEAGTAAIIVPLCRLDALIRSQLDLARFQPLAEAGLPPLVYLYCAQTRDSENHLSARFFFEAGSVREDPATGNGAAFLGAYLLEHAPGSTGEIYRRIEQGHGLGRPSLIHLRAQQAATGREVRVGGRVIANMAGELLPPGRYG